VAAGPGSFSPRRTEPSAFARLATRRRTSRRAYWSPGRIDVRPQSMCSLTPDDRRACALAVPRAAREVSVRTTTGARRAFDDWRSSALVAHAVVCTYERFEYAV